jgi:hypothetical protein
MTYYRNSPQLLFWCWFDSKKILELGNLCIKDEILAIFPICKLKKKEKEREREVLELYQSIIYIKKCPVS